MSRRPTFREVVGDSLPGDLQETLTLMGLGRAAFPAAGANGTVTQGVTIQKGALGVSTAVLVGDGSTAQFTVAHGLATLPSLVRGFKVLTGALQPVFYRWAPYPGNTTGAVLVNFPSNAPPVAGVAYQVAVMA